MNNWEFNEVTQADLYDFKACKHNKTGEIYGIKDSSTCQSGKEISQGDLEKLAAKANKGDKAAAAELKKIDSAMKKQKAEQKKEEQAAAAKKKAAEAEKGKKGKGKKGKKGGKGKKGKGGKGGGAAKPASKPQTAQQKQQARKAAVERARDTVKRLQKMLREATDPKARQQIQKAIGDLMKSVVDAAKADMGATSEGASLAGQTPGEAKNEKA